MATVPTGYLIPRTDDGYGPPLPLVPGRPFVVGRGIENRAVVKDEMCSRHHAEFVPADGGGWTVRDLGSLNGSELNGKRLTGPARLAPLDQLKFGRAQFLFVETLAQLPDRPTTPSRTPDPGEKLAITRRLTRTKYLPRETQADGPAPTILPSAVPPPGRVSPTQALGLLFQLGVELAEAQSPQELAALAVGALIRATPAEVGAVLAAADGRDMETLAYQNRTPGKPTFYKVSRFVSREVLVSQDAVLAENIAGDESLRRRDSISELNAASLICAPIVADGRSLGVLHLFSTALDPRLTHDDLELALAVARQIGVVWAKLRVQSGLTAENRALKDQLRIESELVGDSPALRTVEQQAGRVAATKATVLIRGESGVGKELVARAIHVNSPRKDRPLVCLNCAALTETLLESELFGHEKGAFTGATERMIGKFEAADGGTIFLDEIGEMAPTTQAKFLRVLEGQPFERVGGTVPIKTDVRVVAATNRPLEDAVRAGQFRKDLYFRLQVVQIDVPPLRSRPDDIAPLAAHFLKRFAREIGRKVTGFSPAALDRMRAYPWPGNVRELRNAIERAVALGSGPTIDEADVWLSPLAAGGTEPTLALPPEAYRPRSIEDMEKDHIARTLDHTDWNKSQAAAILGIERSTLDRKIKAYGIVR
ncbi:MAG: sigma 54-interacting transcriptional regulator [Fimbriiglobus sp.]